MLQRQFEALSDSQQIYALYSASTDMPITQRQFTGLTFSRQLWHLYEALGGEVNKYKFESETRGQQLFKIYTLLEEVAAVLPAPTELVVTVNDGEGTFDFSFTPAIGSTGSEYSLNGAAYVDLAAATSAADIEAPEGTNTLRVRSYYADDARGGIATRTFEVEAAFVGTTLLVGWDEVAGSEDGILVEWGTDGLTFPHSAILPPDTESYEATGLQWNTAYYFRVRSFIGAVYSNILESGPIWTSPEFPPSALAGEATGPDTIQLTWTEPANTPSNGGYRIRGEATVGGLPPIEIDVPSGTATADASSLESSHEYSFTIASYNTNAGGFPDKESSQTAAILITTDPENVAPQIGDVTVDATGLTVTFLLDEPCTGNSGFTLTGSPDDVTLTYVSGDGTDERVFTASREIYNQVAETLTAGYAPGDVEDLVGNPMAAVSGIAVTNNSQIVDLLIDEDFELTGAPAGWTAVVGTPNFDSTSFPESGSQSLGIQPSAVAKSPVFDPALSAGIEVKGSFVRFNNSTSNRHALRVIGTSDQDLARFGISNSQSVYLHHGEVSGGVASDIGATAGSTRYWFRLLYKPGTGADGIAKLWLSTTSALPETPSVSITTGGGTDSVKCIYFGNGTASGPTYYFDNIKAHLPLE